MGHALAQHFISASRSEELEAGDVNAPSELFALAVHPEDAEGERGIDRRLRFFGADSQDGESGLALAQESAGVDRAAGMFEVGAIAESVEPVAGKFAL
jgi:hypothetical protein